MPDIQLSPQIHKFLTENTLSDAEKLSIRNLIGANYTLGNASVNAAIATDTTESRNTLKSPKIGMSAGAKFGGKFMSTAVQTNPQVRGLYIGDSICYPPDVQLRSLFGCGGTMFASGDSTRAGGATATTNPDFSKSFNGGWVNLGTGTATYHELGVSTEGFLARQIQVWFWSETGGGTFSVGYDVTSGGVGSYTTLTSANSTIGGTATVTGGTGVVDSSEGAAGALRVVTFTLTNPEILRIRVTGLTGSAKIVCVGGVEVPSGGMRLPGYVAINTSFGGTDPTQWDDLPDAALATLIEQWNPDFVYVRGYEQQTHWANEFAAYAAKIRAIKPGIQFIVAGMHVTGDNNTNVLDVTDKWQQEWCDANEGVFIPIRNRMGDVAWGVTNYLYAAAFYGAPNNTFTLPVTGTASNGILTSGFDHTFTPGKWVRFESLLGGSNLKISRAYRVLAVPSATTFTLADVDGVTPVSLGTDIASGGLSFMDTTHLSQDGASYIANLVVAEMPQATLPRMFLDGLSDTVSGWQRKVVTPSNLQTTATPRTWVFAGPSLKRRTLGVGRVSGSSSASGYPTQASIGGAIVGGNEIGFLSGINDAGFGMAWDTNYAVIGDNPSASSFRGMNASSGGTSDKLEVYNGNSGLASLAVSTAGSTIAHKPLLILRNLASTASKGTAVTHFESTGELRYQAVGITTSVKSGTNALAGTFVANGATPVAVATTAWDANCVVHITLKTVGGAGPTMTPFVSSVTPGTGFSVNSVVGDTSTYNWVAMKVN